MNAAEIAQQILFSVLVFGQRVCRLDT